MTCFCRPTTACFVWQRQDRLGAGRAEVLVKVANLVNGTTVVQQDGGFVDYFQLLFDDHQIIFAEGIAAKACSLTPHPRGPARRRRPRRPPQPPPSEL